MVPNGSSACPAMAFRYKGSLCACNPGRYMVNGSCAMLDARGDWVISPGASRSPAFLIAFHPFDTFKSFTQSQAVLLEVTLVLLIAWLGFCFALRFARVDGGVQSLWFRLRWWISRVDFFYNTHHWLDDNKVVIKRKTELGGTFSVASCILFVGLLSALLYQIITRRSIEVHRVRPATATDISFVNDLEFNITVISDMSCSNLRGLDSLVIGTPGFIGSKVVSLPTYVNHRCQNTSIGPTISLKCNSCQILRREYYISWQFVDLPINPASAVGFQFKHTAKSPADSKYVSYASGTINSCTFSNDKPKTFRGHDVNVLKIHLFPRTYYNLENLKLIQPLFHDFIPGTSFSDINNLQASLQEDKDGLVNITVYANYLSDYIVEIDKENMLGIVAFLANVGGLYVFSLAIFLLFLVQFDGTIKKFRSEDTVMRNIIRQNCAKRNWDKVRKYVMYTWGVNTLAIDDNNSKGCRRMMIDSCSGIQALHRKKQPSRIRCILVDILEEASQHPKALRSTLEENANAMGPGAEVDF
ncbi:uncharacterized protein LOC141819653 [Curcuma longa]|uniref:uncharacterized protein LOC141819653 n=1 Tax=Curcuma longa TaxID=136217 RepID=UPI003D9E6423